jgi:PadR family transcriptional regulator, regulatory protein PadR
MICIVLNILYICKRNREMGLLTSVKRLHFIGDRSILKFKIDSMNIDNTASQMRKGVLEFCILSIIKQGEAYPSDIIEKMKSANLNILEGTLYPLLTRLKNAEFLTYRWIESNSGPPRKYFSLTEKGAAFYKELESTWHELANAVKTLSTAEQAHSAEQEAREDQNISANPPD